MDAAPLAPPRAIAPLTRKVFAAWTTIFWGGTGVLGALFYLGVLDFPTSTRISLYGTSIWLNGCLLPLALPGAKTRDRAQLIHECLALWLFSYAMTNLLWEIPWVLASPFVFEDLHTLGDVVARTEWMRESPVNMYWWVLASFSSVDLRTINHDGTFYALELYAFINVASIVWFFRANRRRSPSRYLVPVLGCGEPIAATFIFSFAEVFDGFANMSGGVAETLLALVWTQYPYILFPAIFGVLGLRLLHADWEATRAAPG